MVGLSQEEHAMLEAIAKRWGVTLSAALRRLVREHKPERLDPDV